MKRRREDVIPLAVMGALGARLSGWCSRQPAILSSKSHRHLAMSGKNSWQREPYRYLSVKSAGGAMSEFGLALALELRLKFQTGGARPQLDGSAGAISRFFADAN
jgi:hypothetical protein